MAQSGYTPLSLYYSATASTAPTAGNLVAGELALNTNDGKLYYKDSSGVVQVIASKAGNVNVSSFSGGTTGLTPNTATTGAVTLAGTLAVANGGTGVTTSTGSGNNVLSTSPTLVTPALGTPSALVLTNATSLPVGGISATGTPSSTTYLRGDGSWATVTGGGGTPGGSTTQVQYNNAGSFAGSAGFVYDNANGILNLSGSTGALTVPRGTTAQRPSSLVAGMIRYNTTTNTTEVYSGISWIAITSQTYTANYLIVAGGGGAGAYSGGGGAGGILSGTTTLTGGTSYSFVVGGGGAGISIYDAAASSGSDSTAFSLTSIGGGGGASYNATGTVAGRSGGSGGGGGGTGNTPYTSSGGSGTSGQGYAGGGGAYSVTNSNVGGGGGGAGAVGTTATTAGAIGNGGIGIQSSITGTATYYAGGGGGGVGTTVSPTTGGLGGGANGVTSGNTVGNNGTVNTGGGGGSSGANGYVGGTGGSGVVIISVPTANYSGTTTGSPNITTSGSNTIIKFTASGSYTA